MTVPSRARDTAADGRFVDDYLPYLLARASHLVSDEFHARLAARGVGVPEWRLLASLYGTQGLTIGELARAMLFKQPTVSKIVDRVEAEGRVVRRSTKEDRRNVRVALTRSGRALVAELILEAREHQDEVLAVFDDREIDLLFRVLRGLITRLGGQSEPGDAAPVPLRTRAANDEASAC